MASRLDLRGAARRRSSASSRRCSSRSSSILPGMIAAVLVTEIAELKDGEAVPGGASGEGVTYNDSLLYLMRDLLPNGLLGRGDRRPAGGVHGRHGGQHLGLQHGLHLRPVADLRPQGPQPTTTTCASAGSRRSAATVIAIFTAVLRQLVLEHHELPADAVRVLQRAAVRDVHPRHVLEADDRDGRLDRPGRPAPWPPSWSPSSARTPSARLSRGVIPLGGQGAAFVAASAAFVVDIVLSVVVSLVTKPKPAAELARSGLLRDPEGGPRRPGRARPTRGTAARCRSPGSRWSWSSSSTSSSEEEQPWRQTHEPSKHDRRRSSTSATSSARCSASTA